ncbi:MAG: hypothetical protein HRO68_09780 [Nitrosopumilus sp.]|nr:hypothetical protein [Nitrosopumilus sp.]
MASALEKAYESVVSTMPEYSNSTSLGWRFMDKFVQMPIVIPPPTPEDKETYADSLFTGLDKKSEEYKIVREVTKEIQENQTDLYSNEVRNEMIQNKLKAKNLDTELLETATIDVKKIRSDAKAKDTITKINEAKENYSDNNPKIQEQISEAVQSFSNNSREMKRFLNLMRFYYIICGENTSKISPDHIRKWIELMMKWPKFFLWLISDQKFGTDFSIIQTRLQGLENNALTAANWKKELTKLLQITSKNGKADNITWLYDKNLKTFFMSTSDKSINLSDSQGLGLF